MEKERKAVLKEENKMPEQIEQEKVNRNSAEPLMKRGNWLASFVDVLDIGDRRTIRKLVIGMYETAQKAFDAHHSFTMPAEVIKQPYRLVLESLVYGDYPDDCIKHQYIMFWMDDLNDYFDEFGIMRASYLLRRENGE